MDHVPIVLTEDDILGASLGKNPDGSSQFPSQLTIPELKRWLSCRGARRTGKKADLVTR